MSQNKVQTYMTIKLQTRKQVVYMMCQQKKTAAQTAIDLELKLSTVKAIYKRYKAGKGFFETKKDKQRREIIEQLNKKRQLQNQEFQKPIIKNSFQNSQIQRPHIPIIYNQRYQVPFWYFYPFAG